MSYAWSDFFKLIASKSEKYAQTPASLDRAGTTTLELDPHEVAADMKQLGIPRKDRIEEAAGSVVGSDSSLGEVNVPLPPHLAGPLARSTNPAVRVALAEFLFDQEWDRDRDSRRSRRTWIGLSIKLLLAWGAIVMLVWFQVKNLSDLMEAYVESPARWFSYLVQLRAWLPVWSVAIPLIVVLFVFARYVWARRLHGKSVWSSDDCVLLADRLRGLGIPDDPEHAAAAILLSEEKQKDFTKSTRAHNDIRTIGRSLEIETRRSRHREWILVTQPKLVTIAAYVFLWFSYIGLTLLPLLWMFDTYLRGTHP